MPARTIQNPAIRLSLVPLKKLTHEPDDLPVIAVLGRLVSER